MSVAAARALDKQALLLQLSHRLAKSASADLQLLRQLGLDHLRLGRQLSGGDRGPQRGERLLA